MSSQLLNVSQAEMNQCALCIENITNGHVRLCPVCEKYANQDYCYQREMPLPHWRVSELTAPKALEMARDNDDEEIRQFSILLAKARLTWMQKRVIYLRFVECQSFFKIAELLGIKKTSAYVHYKRGLKKIKKRLTIYLLVRGENHFRLSRVKEFQPVQQSETFFKVAA